MTLLAISADSHVTEPGDCYVDRIDPKYRADFDYHCRFNLPGDPIPEASRADCVF